VRQKARGWSSAAATHSGPCYDSKNKLAAIEGTIHVQNVSMEMLVVDVSVFVTLNCKKVTAFKSALLSTPLKRTSHHTSTYKDVHDNSSMCSRTCRPTGCGCFIIVGLHLTTERRVLI
jgi:hypothetical protein